MRCAILGYGACFPLVQLQHDRWLLTKLLGRGRAVPALALKWAAADAPYCPTYFQEYNYALADMRRRKGPAQLFVTIAPGVFATEWPDMVANCRAEEAPLSCGVEAIYLHHILVQIFERYIVGVKAKGHDVFCAAWVQGDWSRKAAVAARTTTARACRTCTQSCGPRTCKSPRWERG